MKKYIIGLIVGLALVAAIGFGGGKLVQRLEYDSLNQKITASVGSDSADIDTQPELLLKACGGSTALSTAYAEVAFDTIIYFSGDGSYDTTNGRFVPPWSGFFRVTYALTSDGANTTTGNYAVGVRRLGVSANQIEIQYQGSTGSSGRINGTIIVAANKGDYISLWALMTESETLYDNCDGSYMFIEALR